MCSCEESGNVLPNNVQQLQSGFLLNYKAKWFASDWSRVFAILYQDGTFVWYESQMASRPEGTIFLKLAPELIATGQYSRRLFQVPALPRSGPPLECMIAIGERRRQRVHFFLAETQQDFNAWWTAIASTLPVATAPPVPTLLPAAPPIATTLVPPLQPIISGPADYQLVRQQPSTTNNTVIVRDSSYGDAAVGLATGAVMGAALSNLAHPTAFYYGGGWGGYSYHQDNDLTIVNNYNVDYNIDHTAPAAAPVETDWGAYDDYDGGYDM